MKINILSRLLYVFQSLPIVVPGKQFTAQDKLVFRFILEGKKARVRYTTLQVSKDKGGKALPNFKKYFYAAQIKPIINWCHDSFLDRWKEIETYIPGYHIQTHLGEKVLPEHMSMIDPITVFTLETWLNLIRQLKLK